MTRLDDIPLDAAKRVGKRGTSLIWSPKRGILRTRLSGFLDAELAPRLLEDMDAIQQAQGVPLRIFADWWNLDGYTTRVRLDYTKWALARRNVAVAEMHFLMRSAVVVMGVNLARLVLPNLAAYGKEEDFLAALDKALG